ncbi:MAG: dTDP-4-dehydrorhamnose reductase [Candidatus Tantalella remota]|nr:dTDP-4-dehydrorhamnose reductase [Candidatus Tantalella remota]
MKILITGSSGMLGSDICEVLGEEHDIVGVDVVDPNTQYSIPNTFCKASIIDMAGMKEVFEKEKPELIVHAAAWADVDGCELDPDKAYEINTRGAENIARLTKNGNIPMIFISTDFVFDGSKKEAYVEEDDCRALGVYAKSKLDAEKAIEEISGDYVIARTSWLYGSGGKNFVNTIIERGKETGSLSVVNDQVGSPTYTVDLARALKTLIDAKRITGAEIYHVSNTGSCTWFGLALKTKELVFEMGDVAIIPITSAELDRSAKRPEYSVLDSGKFSRVTGHAMRPWGEALEEYLNKAV